MSRRLDRETDYIPIDWLSTLEADVKELKATNQEFGPDSLVIKRSVTANTWDINGDAIAANALKQYQVTFTPTNTQNAYVELPFSYSITSANGFETFFLWPDTGNTSATVRTWHFALLNSANAITLYVKFAAKCVDTGTLGVVAL